MISLDKELKVFRLLHEGRLSLRSIGICCGVDRNTVAKLAELDGPRPRKIQPPGKGLAPQIVESYDCLGCERVVNLDPCVICAAKLAREQGLTAPGGSES